MRGNGMHNELSIALSGLLQGVWPRSMRQEGELADFFLCILIVYIDIRHLAYLPASTNRMILRHIRLVHIHV